jgi:S-adenosylmethionine decarboxylase proenzyme
MQGLHLTADLADCRGDAALMTETSALRELCLVAVREAGLTPVGELFHRFEPAGDSRQCGITGVVLLAESHLAVHTWPEIGGATVDAYVCNFGADNSARARALLDRIVAGFAPVRQARQQFLRSAPA